MSKILIIETCWDCNHRRWSNGSGRCLKAVSLTDPARGRKLLFDGSIPPWCPLDDNEIYPYKDMIMDIGAAMGNQANGSGISDAALLKQIYKTLEEKP
jgi:hypothetical protein